MQSVKSAIGLLLLSVGFLVNVLTVLAAVAYVAFAVLWMHAPLVRVFGMVSISCVVPVAVGWLCWRVGRSLRSGAGPAVASTSRKRLVGAAIAVGVICAAIGLGGFGIGELSRYDITFLPMAIATRNLAFTPVDLAGTPFARLESLGGRAETMSGVRSRLYRGFRLPEGHRLTLLEHDMSADGIRSWRAPADEPERINGRPARLSVLKDGGNAVSHLSWEEGRRGYELWIDTDVVRERLRDRLFALAASLPPSIPACPRETPPKPRRFGPDGWPVDEPPPRVLTGEQVAAMVDRSKRPCK